MKGKIVAAAREIMGLAAAITFLCTGQGWAQPQAAGRAAADVLSRASRTQTQHLRIFEDLEGLVAEPPTAMHARGARLLDALEVDGRTRRDRLEAIVRADPDYGPAYFLLAHEFSAEKVGEQTLYQRRREFEALDAFLELDRRGKLASLFQDKTVLAGWLERARGTHVISQAFLQTTPTAPVAQFSESPRGWRVAVSLPEAATRVAYRFQPDGAFIATGDAPRVGANVGTPVPLTSWELPKDLRQGFFEVTYEDMAGQTQGPFRIPFDAAKERVRNLKKQLERSPRAWLSVRRDAAQRTLLDFAPLVSARCAIRTVEFGFDEAPLLRRLPLPPCDAAVSQAGSPPEISVAFPLPAGKKTVSVQLTYIDGVRSETVVFPDP